MRTGTVHIKLGEGFGELLTSIVREIGWGEGQRQKAIIMLVDSMVDMSIPQAEEIIDGKKKLVMTADGEHSELVEDNWKAPDVNKMEKYVQKLIDILFHAESSELGSFARTISDVSDITKEDWIRDARNIMEWRKVSIVKAYRKAQVLFKKIYSYLKSYPGYDPSGSSIVEKIKTPLIANIMDSSMDDEAKVKTIRTAKGITEAIFEGVNIVIDINFEYDIGWLNRDGIYNGCELGQHIALSESLVNDFYPLADVNKAQEYLEDHGWAKCSNSKWYYDGSGLNPKQIQTIKQWAEKWGEPLSWNSHECMMSEIMRKRGKIRY